MGNNMSKEYKELEEKIDKLDYRFKRLFDILSGRKVAKESCERVKHEEVELEIGARKVWVDKKLASLVSEMNKVGLVTTECCEGRGGRFDPAYLCLDMRCIREVSANDKQIILRWYPQ